jgi:hypothetical protein
MMRNFKLALGARRLATRRAFCLKARSEEEPIVALSTPHFVECQLCAKAAISAKVAS